MDPRTSAWRHHIPATLLHARMDPRTGAWRHHIPASRTGTWR